MKSNEIEVGKFYVLPHIKEDKTVENAIVSILGVAPENDSVLYNVINSSDMGYASLDWFKKRARPFIIKRKPMRDIFSDLEKLLSEN